MYKNGQSARIYRPGFVDKYDHAISWSKDLLSTFWFLLIYQQKWSLNREKLCPSEGGDKAFICISHDQWVTWLGGWDTLTIYHPHHKVMVRETELNNKNIYVLKIGASLCYNLG